MVKPLCPRVSIIITHIGGLKYPQGNVSAARVPYSCQLFSYTTKIKVLSHLSRPLLKIISIFVLCSYLFFLSIPSCLQIRWSVGVDLPITLFSDNDVDMNISLPHLGFNLATVFLWQTHCNKSRQIVEDVVHMVSSQHLSWQHAISQSVYVLPSTSNSASC